MGSDSDLPVMIEAVKVCEDFNIPYTVKVLSAHRNAEGTKRFASTAQKNGLQVIIAGAGGAAHLPGMTASQTKIPVLGVPIKSKHLDGVDSILSIAQMPKGIPVGTLAIGEAGAANAAAVLLNAKELLRFCKLSSARLTAAFPEVGNTYLT